MYDYFVNGNDEAAEDLLEEYENYEDAEKSEYKEVFSVLRNVIDMLE